MAAGGSRSPKKITVDEDGVDTSTCDGCGAAHPRYILTDGGPSIFARPYPARL